MKNTGSIRTEPWAHIPVEILAFHVEQDKNTNEVSPRIAAMFGM